MSSALTGGRRTRPAGPFIATKEHRRFAEFADAVRRDSYIGLCSGPAGVGKTISARRYANWDAAEELLEHWGPRQDSDARVYAALSRSRAVFYTPTTTCTHRQIDADLDRLVTRVDICIDQHTAPTRVEQPGRRHHAQLLIIDEADRLNERALEHIRDRPSRSASRTIRSSTVASALRTPTGRRLTMRGRCLTMSSRSFSAAPGGSSDSRWTSATSPTPKRSQRSRASRAGTSGSCIASSHRSRGSCASTTSASSPATSCKAPGARWSSVTHSLPATTPHTAEGHTLGIGEEGGDDPQ